MQDIYIFLLSILTAKISLLLSLDKNFDFFMTYFLYKLLSVNWYVDFVGVSNDIGLVGTMFLSLPIYW